MQTRPETMSAESGTPVSQLDPMDYPIPGQSLTDDPRNSQVEQSPHIVDPEQAVEEILSVFNDEEIKNDMLATMASGFPVEAIVKSFVVGGVAEGKFNPDVAEIIKPVIALFLIKMALEEGIPVVPFVDEVDSPEQMAATREEDMMRGMETIRPERARYVKGKRFVDDFTQRAQEEEGRMVAREEINRRQEEMPMESDGSFLEMEEV